MGTLRDDLIAAKSLIDTPEKWIKHDTSRGSCYCALGAVAAVVRDDLTRRARCHDALSANVPDGGYFVAKFNDDPDTTHADVMALFDRAIAAADPSPSARKDRA